MNGITLLQFLENNLTDSNVDLDLVIRIGDEFYPIQNVYLSSSEEEEILDKDTIIFVVNE